MVSSFRFGQIVQSQVVFREQLLAPTDAHIKESPSAGQLQQLRGLGLPSPVGRLEIDALSPALAQSRCALFGRCKESFVNPRRLVLAISG
jgi:hypothetical protein